mgnify:CR=1 FL=1
MFLSEILASRGLSTERLKLVRHKDKRWDVEELKAEGWLEAYQSYQGQPVFKGCEHLLSFVGEERGRSRFFGAFRVGPCSAAERVPLPEGCLHVDWGLAGNVHDELTRCAAFDDLEDRLVIDWGKGALAWRFAFFDSGDVFANGSKQEALELESFFQNKLGTRAFGLNAN